MLARKSISIIVAILLLIAILLTTGLIYYSKEVSSEKQSSSDDQQQNLEYINNLFSTDQIMKMEISVDESQWQELLNNATDKEYISCDVTVNGVTFNNVGIRTKGNQTLRSLSASDSDRYSFKLEFDHYIEGQTCFGLDKFVINNIQSDNTYMKEHLSYQLMNYIGVPSSLCAFSDVSVNGETWGFYIAIEGVEESYAQRNFGSDYGSMYKPETVGQNNNMNETNENQGLQKDVQNNTLTAIEGNTNDRPNGNFSDGGASLKYTDDNLDSYPKLFANSVFKSTDEDKQRVVTALKNLNDKNELEQYVDVDEVLRYFAANTVLVNLDSYVCEMSHNYYLYEKDGQISIVPWDFNLSYAGFGVGSSSDAVNFPIDTPTTSSISLEDRPLLGKLLEVPEYKELYHKYLQEIVTGYFNSGLFEETIDNLNSMISSYVQNDPSAFCTYEEYTAGVETLKEFGKLRAESIQGQLNGSVPSTRDGQNSDPSSLIDASGINISDMGSQNFGGIGPNSKPGIGFPGYTEFKPDMLNAGEEQRDFSINAEISQNSDSPKSPRINGNSGAGGLYESNNSKSLK